MSNFKVGDIVVGQQWVQFATRSKQPMVEGHAKHIGVPGEITATNGLIFMVHGFWWPPEALTLSAKNQIPKPKAEPINLHPNTVDSDSFYPIAGQYAIHETLGKVMVVFVNNDSAWIRPKSGMEQIVKISDLKPPEKILSPSEYAEQNGLEIKDGQTIYEWFEEAYADYEEYLTNT